MKRGINGNDFNFSYTNRDSEKMIADMGMSVVKLAEVTPGGILMFFPSYSLMNKIYQTWEVMKIDKEIEKYKSLLLEPKESPHYPMVISTFYNDVYTKGSILMGVCRGKIAEGLDFSDNAARAVIIVGVPFPLKIDPRTIMKQYYLDEHYDKNTNSMNSQKWYLMQATRATNQAIGRVIRHAEDFGNIILMDQRFADRQNKESISKWLKDQLIEYDDFESAIEDYADFFEEMEQKNFIPKVDRLEKIKLEFNELDDDANNSKIKNQIEEDSNRQKATEMMKERAEQKKAMNKPQVKINGLSALMSIENTSCKKPYDKRRRVIKALEPVERPKVTKKVPGKKGDSKTSENTQCGKKRMTQTTLFPLKSTSNHESPPKETNKRGKTHWVVTTNLLMNA